MFRAGLLIKAKIPGLKKLASKGFEIASSKIQNKERVKKPHEFRDDKTMYRFKVKICFWFLLMYIVFIFRFFLYSFLSTS
jgi:hypothetical protein